jgi:hypothetical protein
MRAESTRTPLQHGVCVAPTRYSEEKEDEGRKGGYEGRKVGEKEEWVRWKKVREKGWNKEGKKKREEWRKVEGKEKIWWG